MVDETETRPPSDGCVGQPQMVSISNSTGYVDTEILPAEPALGNRLVVGILVINITSSTTIALVVEISYDNGVTWKTFAVTTTSKSGPKELACGGVDAAWCRLRLNITSGTSAWAMLNVTKNWSCAPG